MRIARLLLRESSRPRLALERDGLFYDVETLERELGGTVEVPSDPGDFHARVVALGCAGLRDLDARLLRGERPASALVPALGCAPLAPCDTERAAYVHADVRLLGRVGVVARVGLARELAGQDALIALPADERRPDFELSVAVLCGDDLRDATTAEARSGIVGYSVLLDWCGRDLEASSPGALASVKGVRAQLGPTLAFAGAVGKPAGLSAWVEIGGERFSCGRIGDLGIGIDEAVARVSAAVAIRAGDVVAVGPLPLGSGDALGRPLRMHESVAASIERIGTLRGIPVPRR